jgi:3-oxoisoapionate decarboxylase
MSESTGNRPADRRTFLKAMGATAIALGSPSVVRASVAAGRPAASVDRPRLGLDTYSLNNQGWTPMQTLEFASRMNLDVIQFSEIRFLGDADWRVALDPANLRAIRQRADELGIALEIGMRSICPTSGTFDRSAGTAEEQLLRMVDAARTLGSPLVRCFLGNQADRSSNIDSHIDEVVKVLRNARPRIVDSGVKISVENHGGDMQARELKRLIEEAGPEFVGATIDSGNAMWTIEDPHLTLETLAPYVLTSHMRDSYVFTSERGTEVQWCRMGEGNIGMDRYLRTYIERCPGKTVNLEVIVASTPRVFNYSDPEAWRIFQTTPAWEFARFLTRCEAGEPRPLSPPPQGGGGSNSEAQRIALEHAEASVRWTSAFLATL